MDTTSGTVNKDINQILRHIESLIGEDYPLDFIEWTDIVTLALEFRRLRIQLRECQSK